MPDAKNPSQEVDNILLGGRIGIIAHAIAGKLGVDGLRALDLFYESETCRRLHDKATGLYLYGDLYIVEEFLRELRSRSA